MIRLYDSPVSPCCMKVRQCLAEKALNSESVAVDLGGKANLFVCCTCRCLAALVTAPFFKHSTGKLAPVEGVCLDLAAGPKPLPIAGGCQAGQPVKDFPECRRI